MPNSVTKDTSGKIHGIGRDGKKYHLNPKMQRQSTTEGRKRPSSTSTHRFKLVTVRALTSEDPDTVEERLREQQEKLSNIALNSGQPIPFPYKIVRGKDDLKTTFGVYVDEDLYGRQQPIYTFTSPDSRIKCFITTSGTGKNDYSVHIGHIVNRTKNPDDSYTVDWRIVSIDSDSIGTPLYYLLESQSNLLHESFRHNFDIDSLHYLGGGGWTGISVDMKDRIAVKGIVKGDASAYIPTSNTFRAFGSTRTPSIVSFSLTPSYVFTWCRDNLVVNQRFRKAEHTTDIEKLKSEGVIESTRKYEYNLDIPNRPAMLGLDISPINYVEYSQATATYVSNLNAPETPGLDVTPDYGTDSQRVSLKNYSQETNIIRPDVRTDIVSLLPSKAVQQSPCFNTICCSSPDMATVIRLRPGIGYGDINHQYELKTAQGSRGFQYGEDYKLWWTYGKIQAFYPTNDGRIFIRSKTAEARGEPSLFPTSETLYDRGELRMSEFPNAVETTWPARVNPPTGFFSIRTGTATWNMEYNNPPIFGHEAVYYYHINPPLPDVDDTLSQVQGTFEDSVNNINTLRNLYGQMQGGLGGDSTTSLHIGRVRKASSANDTLPILSPSPSQKADMETTPEKFPVGFFETAIFDEVVNQDNSSTITTYNTKGETVKTYTV